MTGTFEDTVTGDTPQIPGNGTPSLSTPDNGATSRAIALSHAMAALQGGEPYNRIVDIALDEYFAAVDMSTLPPPHIVEAEMTSVINAMIEHRNQLAPITERWAIEKHLSTYIISRFLLRYHQIVRVMTGDRSVDDSRDLLAMYISTGYNQGIYSTSEARIFHLAAQYNKRLTINDRKELKAMLLENSDRHIVCASQDLVPVNNGVFNYSRDPVTVHPWFENVDGETVQLPPVTFQPRTLNPFDSRIVFLAKSHVNYVDNPVNPVITNPDGSVWDVVSWVGDLSEDEGVPELLWEILGAIVRPYVRWGKAAWFYSEQGNNGKGTLCALMRNLVGEGSYAVIPLTDFGKEFALEVLVHCTAIITDENNVGVLIDKAANLKAIVTHDVIPINRKHRTPISYRFHGFMVQCLNGFPRAKDKSDSFYRRQLFVPLTKNFNKTENTAIKDDYLRRPEVLEYVLWHVLNLAGSDDPGCYYTLSTPPVALAVLEEYKQTNDPVRAFWSEMSNQLVWDLLPFTFLYDLYKPWFADVSPSGSPVSSKQFIADLLAIVHSDTMWGCPDKNRSIRTNNRMDGPEPLIAEYNLVKWKNPSYSGTDPLRISMPALAVSYRGLVRTGLAPAVDAPQEDDALSGIKERTTEC